MQSTILFLQQELKTTRDRIQVLEKENFQLKTGVNPASQDDQVLIKNEEEMCTDTRGDDDDVTTNVINGNMYGGNDVQMQQQIVTEQIYKQTTIPPPPANVVTPHHTTQLETIDESVNMRPNNAYYNNNNGSEDVTMSELIHEGNGGGAIGAKLRTVASRKRNYECDAAPLESISVVPMAAQPVCMISSPRTLPPKKSKLRVVPPTRRSSIQSIDENEILINTSAVNSIVDNAMDGMMTVNDEVGATTACGGGDPLANDATVNIMEQGSGGMAQRIMVRRRSLRLNGASNGGGGGGDSNH